MMFDEEREFALRLACLELAGRYEQGEQIIYLADKFLKFCDPVKVEVKVERPDA